jgi:hypothetical protein
VSGEMVVIRAIRCPRHGEIGPIWNTDPDTGRTEYRGLVNRVAVKATVLRATSPKCMACERDGVPEPHGVLVSTEPLVKELKP